MKYLKKFNVASEYDAFKSGEDYILPNVSYIVDNEGVMFNPYVEPLNPNVVCVYDIDDISKESFIIATPQYLSKMIIDGVVIEPTEYYQFDSIGNHTIEFTLIDNTIFPSKMFYKTISGDDYGYGGYGYGYQSANIEKCGLISAKIPYGVETICTDAFQGTQLESIELPKSLKTIEYYAFYDCKNLTSINIPDSVTEIGDYAFSCCSNLTNVIIGNSVTSIGDYAFDRCSNLTSINIPNSVTLIGEFAFLECSSLPTIDNIRYADTYLVGIADNQQTTYIIKEGTKWIGDIAFADCSNLTSINIPNSVTLIGRDAFRGCSSLTSIDIPDSVTSIGRDTFADCSNLTNVIIGNSVTSIGYSAFQSCSRLTSIVIPNSVTTIDSRAFTESGLTSITCLAPTAPSIESDTFYLAPYNGILKVPTGSDYSSWMSTSSHYLGYYGWTIQYI